MARGWLECHIYSRCATGMLVELATLMLLAIGVAAVMPSHIFTPDDFKSDWYGYATNQIGHAMLIGGVGTFLLALSYWTLFGVYPYRIHLFLAIVVAYSLYECCKQGWHGWDSVEDIIFTAVYGAGGSLWCFRADANEQELIFDPHAALVPFSAMAIHLGFGIASRRLQNDVG